MGNYPHYSGYYLWPIPSQIIMEIWSTFPKYQAFLVVPYALPIVAMKDQYELREMGGMEEWILSEDLVILSWWKRLLSIVSAKFRGASMNISSDLRVWYLLFIFTSGHCGTCIRKSRSV